MLSSTAGALEQHGKRLGEFEEVGNYGGRPYYKQRDTEGTSDVYMYKEGRDWWVSDTLGGSNGWLRNSKSGSQPPASNSLTRVSNHEGMADTDTLGNLTFTHP